MKSYFAALFAFRASFGLNHRDLVNIDRGNRDPHHAFPRAKGKLRNIPMPRADQPYAFDGPFWYRMSTRLNSSHLLISYAVFCVKHQKSI